MKIAGSPRVEGDEEEDDIDDLEHEFDFANLEACSPQELFGEMVSAHFNTAYCAHTNTSETATRTPSELGSSCPPEIPRLTYDEEVNKIALQFLRVCVCAHTRT
ncbi:hypothetical protein CsSME_00002316 [Camellia sinensis var. sinensis]